MHELSLCGSVPIEQYHRTLQQLAGVTSMQPQDFEEVHIILKSRTPPGLEKLQGSSSAQGSQQQQQEIQRLKGLLQGGIYNVKLIGKITPKSQQKTPQINGVHSRDQTADRSGQSIEWTLEFKDTPAAGKQATNTRLISRTKLGSGNLVAFFDVFGFEYVTRYYVEGCRFYDHDTTLSLYRIRSIPDSRRSENACDISRLPARNELPLIDPSGAYTLQASIDIIDGNSEDLKNRASEQLVRMRDTLKQAVDLAPADRLSLDTRITVPVRRV